MTKVLKFILNVSVLIVLSTVGVSFFARAYEIKKNDSLSCLAESRVGSPVYGENGSLDLLLKVNKKENGSGLILVGDVIKFPSSDKTKDFTPVDPKKISSNCLKEKVKKDRVEASCKAPERKIASSDHQMHSCNEICPHIHDNEGHAISFLGKKKIEDSKENIEVSKAKERYIREVGLYQSSMMANSRTDATNAEWVSRNNFYLKGGYQISRNNWWYGFTVEYHLPSFEDVNSIVYTWDGDLPNLLKFSVTADSAYKRLNYGFSLDYNQELFFTEELFEVSLEEVFTLGATINLSYNYLYTENYLSDFGVRLSYPYKGFADMDPEGEFSYLLYLNLTKSSFLDKFEITFSAFYGEKNFRTNRFDQVEEYTGFSLTLKDKVNL